MTEQDDLTKFLPDNPRLKSLAKEYVSEPSDKTFGPLMDSLGTDSTLIDLLYAMSPASRTSGTRLLHLIRATFLARRFVETIYLCGRYRDAGFEAQGEVFRLLALSTIEGGRVDLTRAAIEACETLGEPRHFILTLYLAWALRVGLNDVAHDLAIELVFEEGCTPIGYRAVVEAAFANDDSDLLCEATLAAEGKGIQLSHSPSSNRRALQMLRHRFATVLCKLSQRGVGL